MDRRDKVWQDSTLVKTFLEGVRGGIPFAAEQLDIMLWLIDARNRAVETFADLGCGNGILTSSLLAKYPEAVGTLVDFSEPMLKEARLRLSDYAVQLSFCQSDFGSKDWLNDIRDRAPFDVIVSGYAIHHQPDVRKRELYQEIFDLLKPGGIFINIEHVASGSAWLESISDNHLVDALFSYHRVKGSGKNRAEIADEYVHRQDKEANILSPVELQCDWLRSIGYKDVDCYFKSFELAVFGGRRPD